jgi:excisionase family DNA binding protein
MRLLTPEQVAEQLAVSRSTVLRMITDKVIPVVCLRRGKHKAVYHRRQEVLEKWVIGKEREQVKRPPSPPITDKPSPGDSTTGNGKALD